MAIIVFSGLTLLYTIIIGALLLYTLVKRQQFQTASAWVALTVGLSGLVGLILLSPSTTTVLPRGVLLALTMLAMLTTYGRVAIGNLHFASRSRFGFGWLVAGGLWLVSLLIATQTDTNARIAEADWIIAGIQTPNIPSLILLVGLGIGGVVLFGSALYGFYTAPLSEIANQSLYWSLNIVMVWTGNALILSGNQFFITLGLVLSLTGISGMLYATTAYRVFNLRGGVSLAVRNLMSFIFTALTLFITLVVARLLMIPATLEGSLLLGVIAIVVAAAQTLIRKVGGRFLRTTFKGGGEDVLAITRQYSQRVSKTIEPEQVSAIATETLRTTLKTRKAALLLATSMPHSDMLEFQVPGNLFGETGNRTIAISKNSPVSQQFLIKHLPVTQYDLEHNPAYASLTGEEHTFFRSLNLGAYAPIIDEESLIGILACGAKVNDAPFYEHDLELLAALANQTGTALRNARLVTDLQRLNREMTRLNQSLEETNAQMQKLDGVKSDFVTIASHELRTPLAQARGYIDIIDTLNEQRMLDPDQTRANVDNLRKATERMEELIAAMLDVSQIDVAALDLKFTQTSIETVVRMAVEPLMDAIKQRKLTVSVRGLKGLPPIEADLQRLVQAFRNVIVNAIKFTPDTGRIETTAKLHKSEGSDVHDSIIVSIKDSGVGINKENLELIFQKFYRGYDPSLHSTGTYKFMGAGPGLGLTIARGIIEGHGGKIWAESPGFNRETYPGSTFHILLPLNPPDDARKAMNLETVPRRPASTNIAN